MGTGWKDEEPRIVGLADLQLNVPNLSYRTGPFAACTGLSELERTSDVRSER